MSVKVSVICTVLLMMDLSVTELSAPSKAQADQLLNIWNSTAGQVTAYKLPLQKFRSLLTAPRAKIFIIEVDGGIPGFALTYLIRNGSSVDPTNQHLKGSLAVLAVDPAFQNQGIGSALHEAAVQYLESAVRSSLSLSTPPAPKSQLQLGSIFPRIFPGLPEGKEFEHALQWLKKRGWPVVDAHSIDLYQPLSSSYEISSKLLEKPNKLAIRFGVPQEGDDERLFALQNKDFGTFTGWPDMFPALIKSGRREDIWCAFDFNGKILGATIAAMAAEERPLHQSLAWPCTIGTACAVISCVGVASDARNTGTGLALMTTALKHLADRGADGCFVDWVSLKGWYQKVGFEPWERAYREAWRDVV